MEITKDKVTELFCIIDEFYKVFDAENAGKLLLFSLVQTLATKIQRYSMCWLNVCMASCLQIKAISRKNSSIRFLRKASSWLQD